MFKKLLHPRSPFWQLLIYGLFFVIALLTALRQTPGSETFTLSRLIILITAGILVLLGFLYAAQMVRYNRRHPKTPIRYFGFLPPELKEEDEGMRMFTGRATRRVYIFHATLLPSFAVLYLYFLLSPIYVIAGLAVLVMGHYGIYLATIWPVLGEDEE